MFRQVAKGATVAVAAASLAGSLSVGAQDAQTTVGVHAPSVINLFLHENVDAPLPAAALAAVAQADGPEDPKTRAARFARGAIPALVGRSLPSVEWQAVGVTGDVDGTHHIRLQQTVAGLRVFGAEVVIHLDRSAAVAGLNGQVLSDIAVPKPALTIDAALKAARQALNGDSSLAPAAGELLIYNPALFGGNDTGISSRTTSCWNRRSRTSRIPHWLTRAMANCSLRSTISSRRALAKYATSPTPLPCPVQSATAKAGR